MEITLRGETAQKLLDETRSSNTLMKRWAESAPRGPDAVELATARSHPRRRLSRPAHRTLTVAVDKAL
jgi:hypothetical protein